MTAMGLTWRKASFSTADDKCVELASAPGMGFAGIRDSKNPNGPILAGDDLRIGAFVAMVKARFNA